MNETAIIVEKLGKQYRIGHNGRQRKGVGGRVFEGLTRPFRRFGPAATAGERNGLIWAIKDVSFEVPQGQVVGVIGRNGAGKSTLLKVLSRITEPTCGRAVIRGTVGSLLEVGTGFHPDLTGRENIYLSGAVLGMKKAQIDRQFDQIVAFAEVEKFLDTPVKRYSSGMYVRLAFAVAAHLEPQILLVDEVLAVGDAAFQRKCLGKMGDVARAGRTVLFVSHNMGAITRLCPRALWLDQGALLTEGPAQEVVQQYHRRYLTGCADWIRPASLAGDGALTIERVAVRDSDGRLSNVFGGDEAISVEIRYVVRRDLAGCQIGSRLCTSEGVVVLTTTDADGNGVSALPKTRGVYRSTFTIPPGLLAPGSYHVFVAAHLPGRSVYDRAERTVVFDVSPEGALSSLDGRQGVVAPLLNWQTVMENAL